MHGHKSLKYILCLWDRASLEQRCKQPSRCNNFRLLIFLLTYLNLLYMFRATISPIFRSTFDCIYSFGTMHRYCCRPVTSLRRNCSYIVALYQSCIYSQKCSWRWVKLSPETCRADSNRSIKRSIKENYCILLVAYIVVLMTHSLTNVKRPNQFLLFETSRAGSWIGPRSDPNTASEKKSVPFR